MNNRYAEAYPTSVTSMEPRANLVESKVTCPHCWHRFFADDAVYISRHAELYGDEVLGEHENKRFAPHEVRRDREGNALDPKGWKMVERACPVCHLQIPATLLSGRVSYISVVGAPRSGKTYLLTSMVHELRKDLAKYFAYSIVCRPIWAWGIFVLLPAGGFQS